MSGYAKSLTQKLKNVPGPKGTILINESHPKYFDLAKISMMANDSFGLRCGAIDILDTVEGLKIIEINNGIMMDGFAAHSKKYFKIAKNAHKKMLFASLQK